MTPGQWIADLDEELRESGQDVTLQLMSGGVPVAGPGTPCRAFVTYRQQKQMVENVSFDAADIVISPTSVAAIPEGSRLTISGRAWRVDSVMPVVRGGAIVRFNVVGLA